MQTCLEIVGIPTRHTQMARSYYTRELPYSGTHENALATGDRKGKGTGHGGHTHWLPNCKGQLGVFNYTNFDTAVASGAGNDIDNKMREESLARSMYNAENPYSAKLVDTTANVREGQYQVP